jgi:hypothetical protein
VKTKFTPVPEVTVGQVIGAGTVTAISVSQSGKTTTFTCKNRRGGVTDLGRGTSTSIAVILCDYQPVEGDPAITVCVTHNPDLGLYGDEWCEQDKEGI